MQSLNKTFARFSTPKYRQGLTLVEMLIVTTLTVTIILVSTSTLLTAMLGSGRVSQSSEVKSNGDYALSQIELLLRNAIVLLPNDFSQTCQNNMDQIRFRSLDEGVTTLFGEDDGGVTKIASNSGIYLTSNSVNVTSGPRFDCVRSDDLVVNTVKVSFTLGKGQAGVDRPGEVIEETFETTVTLRNF